MPRRCEEAHCLEIVPEHLFQAHQDQHLAERLAAEEFEQRQREQTDAEIARTLADSSGNPSFPVNDEDADFQLALSLNRQFRAEEEELSFRDIQVFLRQTLS